MEVGKGRARSAGPLIGDVPGAWVSQSLATWALSSALDQEGRVEDDQGGPIARIPLARLTVSGFECADTLRQQWRGRKANSADGNPAPDEELGTFESVRALM